MSEHTPTPWKVGGYCCRPNGGLPKGTRIIAIRDDGFEFHIAVVGTHPQINADHARANAAFIVKAVNGYDETQDLLTDLWFHFSDTFDPVLKKIAERARALIHDPVSSPSGSGK